MTTPTTNNDPLAGLVARLAELDAKVPHGWEFEKSDGEYYNLQVEHVICEVPPETPKDDPAWHLYPNGKVTGHPMVLMKTLKGWAPEEDVAQMIIETRNALPTILQQLRGAAAMRDALAGLMAVYDEGGAGNNYWSEEEPLWEAARNALQRGAGDGR
jgi:hypothetical protein